jgi:hypothetical protein
MEEFIKDNGTAAIKKSDGNHLMMECIMENINKIKLLGMEAFLTPKVMFILVILRKKSCMAKVFLN